MFKKTKVMCFFIFIVINIGMGWKSSACLCRRDAMLFIVSTRLVSSGAQRNVWLPLYEYAVCNGTVLYWAVWATSELNVFLFHFHNINLIASILVDGFKWKWHHFFFFAGRVPLRSDESSSDFWLWLSVASCIVICAHLPKTVKDLELETWNDRFIFRLTRKVFYQKSQM